MTELNPQHWIELYGDALFRYALKRVRTVEHAEDLVQDTLMVAFESREKYKGNSSELTWLTGILKHKVLDYYRTEFREMTGAEDDSVMNELESRHFDADGHWTVRVDAWALPDQQLQAKEFWRITDQCLGSLPSKSALLFRLREIEGMETDEICEQLDISANNVWTILSRARMKLRDYMQQHWLAVD